MRAAWRLATNSLAGRRRRTALLAMAIALSTSLVAAVACSLASLNAGMESRVASTLGAADIRIHEVAGGRFDARAVEGLATRAGVAGVSARLRGPIPLKNPATGEEWVASGVGIDPAAERAMVATALDRGRPVEKDGEVVLGATGAEELGADVGDTLEVMRFGDPLTLRVVGVEKQLTVNMLSRPGATTTRSTLEEVTGYRGRLSEVMLSLRDGADIEAAAREIQQSMPRNVQVEPTERVASGIDSMIRANRFLFALASAGAFLASAFIVLTGMTTSVLERQRELAIVRCVGGRRGTLAGAQLLSGGLLGALGASVGVPAGIVLAWILTVVFPDRLPAGLRTPLDGLTLAAAGAIVSGVLGALWPAWSASRVSPIAAMAARAAPASLRGVALVGAAGLVGVLMQAAVVAIADSPEEFFLGYMFVGLEGLFFGYVLLGVPVVAGLAIVLGPGLERLLRLPRGLLRASALATPYRNGLTAGALMLGLAMMTSMWTNGSAVLRDWLGSIDFPDAFVHGWLGLTEQDRETIESLDFVSGATTVTLFKIDSDRFGIDGLRQPPTNFIAFEPDAMFGMTRLRFVEGDPVYAERRIREGGAVLVAQEFLLAREGLRIGDAFTVTTRDERHEFEVVGAVSSPGLDIVSAYFDIGREYADQAIGAVFGSRDDLRRVFASDAITLIQIGLKGEISDDDATQRIRAALPNKPLVVGSGRQIRKDIEEVGRGSMRLGSLIAVGVMLIGCAGVGNIVVAGIDARRFEFGVLRAIGADSGLLARLILGEALLVGLGACVIGTALGLQDAVAALKLIRLAAGIEATLIPPAAPILMGWAILLAMTLGAAALPAFALSRQRPRELLGAVRG